MDDYSWLAGLLEGEGSFQKGPPSEPGKPRVVLSMGDEDIVRRAAVILSVKSVHRYEFANPRWKPYYRMQVSGQRAVDLMTRIRPMMGQRRRVQIDNALACWHPVAERNLDRDAAILRLYRRGTTSYAEVG